MNENSGPELQLIPTKPTVNLPKTEGEALLQMIESICMTWQSTQGLPEIVDLQRDPNHFIEQILRLLEEFQLISK